MSFVQMKITRAEWKNMEVPICSDERQILGLINDGYSNINVTHNNTLSLNSFLKIVASKPMDNYLYNQYFKTIIDKQIKKHSLSYKINCDSKFKIKKADQYRIENMNENLVTVKNNIFEFILLNLSDQLLKYYHRTNNRFVYYYYTLTHLLDLSIHNNSYIVIEYIKYILTETQERFRFDDLIYNGKVCIEQNIELNMYKDIRLYSHQQKLFCLVKIQTPKLILYIAPTGTGKTISPIGLTNGKNRVIFLCAARHVGLALAKSAISMNKKIGFAFGCNTIDDIRLHNYSAKDYVKNWKTGGIFRVDHSNGENVEMIICDIKSYTYAMYFMKAFNPVENIILYWDEPTISLDYDYHPLHESLRNNWQNNIIPNVILSSATLPQADKIEAVICNFKQKFPDALIETITNHDCKKSISVINKEGYTELPHFYYKDYSDILRTCKHCFSTQTLLRYLDFTEIVEFIQFVHDNHYIQNLDYCINKYFTDIMDLTIDNIKIYYLILLMNLKKEKWDEIYLKQQSVRTKKYDSTINILTSDAHTLTTGPTIFLTDEIEKVGKIYLKSVKIPEKVLKDLLETIDFNNKLNTKINDLEKEFQSGITKHEINNNKSDDKKIPPELQRIREKISEFRLIVKPISLNNIFIPNRKDHFNKWCMDQTKEKDIFTSEISDYIVEKIMLLNNIDDGWKLLLLMGVGVFTQFSSSEYMEIMKELAYEQKLFVLIASSDYIYGTNYQFCHSYIAKDLLVLSQEKLIQAMGRVGRQNMQKNYSIRLRDNKLFDTLFMLQDYKPEVYNMNKLFG